MVELWSQAELFWNPLSSSYYCVGLGILRLFAHLQNEIILPPTKGSCVPNIPSVNNIYWMPDKG